MPPEIPDVHRPVCDPEGYPGGWRKPAVEPSAYEIRRPVELRSKVDDLLVNLRDAGLCYFCILLGRSANLVAVLSITGFFSKMRSDLIVNNSPFHLTIPMTNPSAQNDATPRIQQRQIQADERSDI